MACSVQDLLNAGQEAVDKNVQYIYGAKWQVLSASQINALRDAYGSDCVWWSDTNKAGCLCCDCSGLVSHATGNIQGTWGLENASPERVDISAVRNNPSAYTGWLLGMSGHVGINMGDGTYCALDGSARNAVRLPLNCNSWRYAYKCADVDYGGGASAPAAGGGASAPSVRYAVYTDDDGWLPFVTDLNDYAGIRGHWVRYLAIDMNGWYQVKTQASGWLPRVYGCNTADLDNGCAGDGSPIVAVRCYYDTPNPAATGYLRAQYRVSQVNMGYYDWQYDNETGNGQDGYAGDDLPIDRFQITLSR